MLSKNVRRTLSMSTSSLMDGDRKGRLNSTEDADDHGDKSDEDIQNFIHVYYITLDIRTYV